MARGQAAVLMDVRGAFELMEFDVPEPAPGAVLVRTELSGVCGTDVHVWDGDLVRYFPRILGHEVIGRVAAIGDGVTSDAIGKPLALTALRAIDSPRPSPVRSRPRRSPNDWNGSPCPSGT